MNFDTYYGNPKAAKPLRMVRQFLLPERVVDEMQEWKDLQNELYRKGVAGVRNYNMADASAKMCLDGPSKLREELAALRQERERRLAQAGVPPEKR